MGWKVEFAKLRQRVIDKTSWAPRTLDNNVQRIAAKHSITTKEALFVIARDNQVGFQADFSKLSKEEQKTVSSTQTKSVRAVAASAKVSSSKKSKPVTRTVSLKTPLGTFGDPYLPPSVIDQAKTMSETVYPYLYVFENSIRNFINLVMTSHAGSNWWTSEMTSTALREIVAVADDRINKESENYYHGKRGAHPLYYIDFTHLIKIIKAKDRVFQKYFANLPGKMNGFLAKLEEIQPSRNVSSHHNPLNKRDLNRIYQYLTDWTSQLQYLKDKSIL
jgi:hypothetical protein